MSVYVGIDAHRKRSQVAVVTEEGTVQLNKNTVNGTEPLLRLIGDLAAGKHATLTGRDEDARLTTEQARVACAACAASLLRWIWSLMAHGT